MEFNNPSTIIKDLHEGQDGRDKLMAGVDTLANAVKSTLGASGKCVIYEDALGNPVITKDGVTVAESVILEDPVENIGATMIKEAAKNTVREAGDGTTTATVLAQSLMHLATDAIKEKKGSVREVKEGMKSAMSEIIAYLDDIAQPVTDKLLKHVATISCNGDEELGKLISNAFEAAGENGDVIMEQSEDQASVTITTVDGAQLHGCGLKSQFWRTNKAQETAELDNPLVLILTSPLNNLRKIQNILEACIKQNRSLLILGELEQQPLATLLANKVKGVVKVNVVDLPGFGAAKQDMVDELCYMTGATAVSEELGDDMDFITPDVLGVVSKSVTDNSKTILQVTDEERPEIPAKIEAIRAKIKKEKNPFMKKKFEEIVNILSGKVSLITIGAESKLEMKEKADRIEDAVYAVKAALKEGIVPGGGIALVNAAMVTNPEVKHRNTQGIDSLMPPNSDGPGELVLRKAVLSPFHAILQNAEYVPADPVLMQIQNSRGQGIDVVTGRVVDMVKHGIIDPVLVTKTALKNAVSVVSTIISTDAILSNQRMKM